MSQHHSDDEKLMQQALDALKQAKDSVADWGAYASEYFQHKHNLQGSIDDIQAQITVLSERLAQPEQEFTPHEEGDDGWSDWVCPDPKSYLMKCCDCGLVHEAQFGVVRYKSEAEREDCEPVGDPNLQAVFRMRRSEQWSPKDTAYRPGGLAQPEQALEPAAKVELMTSGGNAGLATRIVEIDDHLRERLRPGQLLYTAPPQRQWRELTDEQADSIINGMRTCLHLDSKRMFLKTWLRDWAAHGIKGDTNAN